MISMDFFKDTRRGSSLSFIVLFIFEYKMEHFKQTFLKSTHFMTEILYSCFKYLVYILSRIFLEPDSYHLR